MGGIHDVEIFLKKKKNKKGAVICEEAEKSPAQAKSYLQKVTYWETFIPGIPQSLGSGSQH